MVLKYLEKNLKKAYVRTKLTEDAEVISKKQVKESKEKIAAKFVFAFKKCNYIKLLQF